MTVVFYVSAHGYGHASRQAALIAALKRHRPQARLLLRSQAPLWLLAPNGEASRRPAAVDPGISQSDGFSLDLETTLRRHERFVSDWEARAAREADFLRREKAECVVADVPPLAFAAAALVGVPAFGVGNFSWDVILEAYVRGQPRWRPIVELYGRAYSGARAFFRLPMHLEAPAFKAVTDCPLLCRRSALSQGQARRALGLPRDGRPVVLASFGGLGRGPLDLGRGDDLSDFLFLGFGPPPTGLKAQWARLPDQTAAAAVDAMAACDAVLAKPGYGALSEALAHGKPVLLPPRGDFAETPALIESFLSLGRGAPLALEDFVSGRWKAPLEKLLAGPAPAPVPNGGAAFLAERLASC